MKWPTGPLCKVAPPLAAQLTFELHDAVWQLSLDQIESETGRIIEKRYGPAGEAGTSTFCFDEDNILYSKLRPYLNKVAIPDERGIATTELVPLRPNTKLVNARFLAYYLRSPTFVRQASHHVAGAKMPRVIMDWFWQHEMPLPSLKEQARLVELLDEADRMRQLRRDADEKAARILPRLFINMFGDPATNPMAWPTIDFGTAVEIGTKLVDPNEPQYRELLHVGGENIERDTGRVLQPKRVADSDLRSGKFLFDEEHVLYSKIRPALNKVCIPGFGGLCSADIYPLRSRDGRVGKHYLASLLRSNAFLNFTVSVADRLRIPKINREQLSKFSFPLPPPELLSVFEHRAAALASLDRSLFRQAQKFDQVWTVMLAEAFSGQLTAKWREGHIEELLAEMAYQASALNVLQSTDIEASP